MLLAVSLSCTLNGNAQITYRGFVEGGLGMDLELEWSTVNFSYMLATTHGVQFKNNFIGVGLGIIPGRYGDAENKISLPLYANWRYDFFHLDKPLKPYIGIKAGYYSITAFLKTLYGWFPLYAALDFGLRKRISDTSGVSFGLSVQNSNDSKAYFSSDGDYRLDFEYGIGISVLAKVAFDF